MAIDPKSSSSTQALASSGADAKGPEALRNVFDDFMLEEFKTIAQAHFDMHASLRQHFRFYLGIVAVPLAAVSVFFKDPNPAISIFELPRLLALLFTVTATIGSLFFIHMANTSFDIILYSRTVNGVRAYFVARAVALTPTMAVTDYLKLPTDKMRPPYREGPSRPYWWLFCLVAVLNSVYAFIAAANYLTIRWAAILSLGILTLHAGAYYGFSAARERSEVPARSSP